LQERRVDIEQARPAQRSASHVPESPLSRQLESKGIEPAVRSARLVATGLRVGVRGVWIANGRIPVRYVGITGTARSGRIGAGQRREGESAGNPEARIPLPTADQFVHDTSGAASEALPIAERQLIAGVPVERVGEAVGSNAAVQLPAIIGTGKIRWLVSSGGGQDGGIHIHDFPPGVIRLISETTTPLRQ